MSFHLLNTFTRNSRFPEKWKTGSLSLLIETEQGLVLVDVGLGAEEYTNSSEIQLTASHMFFGFFND